MIYNGICPDNSCTINGSAAGINASLLVRPDAPSEPEKRRAAYNNPGNDNAHMGYMFGAVGSATPELTHTNDNNSTIKNLLENWYNNNLTSTEKLKIAKVEYCNDRTSFWDVPGFHPDGGFGKNQAYYGAFIRVSGSNKAPTLICLREIDKLKLSIGLITADEVSLAGGASNVSNVNYYLRSDEVYWTMSPNQFHNLRGEAHVSHVDRIGVVHSTNLDPTTAIRGVRPVIALRSDVKIISGDGSALNPYII